MLYHNLNNVDEKNVNSDQLASSETDLDLDLLL